MKKSVEELAVLWTAAYATAFAVTLHAQTITEEGQLNQEGIDALDETARLIADRVTRTIEERGNAATLSGG